MVELEACKTLINLQHLIKDDQFMAIVNTLQKLLVSQEQQPDLLPLD